MTYKESLEKLLKKFEEKCDDAKYYSKVETSKSKKNELYVESQIWGEAASMVKREIAVCARTAKKPTSKR